MAVIVKEDSVVNDNIFFLSLLSRFPFRNLHFRVYSFILVMIQVALILIFIYSRHRQGAARRYIQM